jgi:hypothetical protein
VVRKVLASNPQTSRANEIDKMSENPKFLNFGPTFIFQFVTLETRKHSGASAALAGAQKSRKFKFSHFPHYNHCKSVENYEFRKVFIFSISAHRQGPLSSLSASWSPVLQL